MVKGWNHVSKMHYKQYTFVVCCTQCVILTRWWSCFCCITCHRRYMDSTCFILRKFISSTVVNFKTTFHKGYKLQRFPVFTTIHTESIKVLFKIKGLLPGEAQCSKVVSYTVFVVHSPGNYMMFCVSFGLGNQTPVWYNIVNILGGSSLLGTRSNMRNLAHGHIHYWAQL